MHCMHEFAEWLKNKLTQPTLNLWNCNHEEAVTPTIRHPYAHPTRNKPLYGTEGEEKTLIMVIKPGKRYYKQMKSFRLFVAVS